MANHAHIEAAEKLAGQQHGVVSREQAVALGMSIPQIGYRLKRGYWLSVHHGVYRIRRMTASTERGRLHAAVKAGQLIAGPEAVAAGETAARLWGLQGLPPWRGEVVLAGRRSKTYAGAPPVRLHSWSIEENESQRRNGVPITTMRRTLRDVIATQDRDTAISLVDSALNGQFVRGEHLLREVNAAGERRPDSRIRRSWWALTDGRAASPLETRVRLRCHDAGIPPDELQFPCHDDFGRLIAVVDLYFDAARALVECDGQESHQRPEALYRDRHRQNRLAQAFPGWRILRFTWRDVFDPDYIPSMILRERK